MLVVIVPETPMVFNSILSTQRIFMFNVRSSLCGFSDFTVPLKLHRNFHKELKTMVELSIEHRALSIEQGLQFHWRCLIAFVANMNAFT